jgi:hypothetical protein
MGTYDVVVSGGGDTCGTGGVGILAATQSAGVAALSWLGVPGATSYRVMAAPDGGRPSVVATTTSTGATVRFNGNVYWWIEAERAGCPSIRSSTMHMNVVPQRRRVTL